MGLSRKVFIFAALRPEVWKAVIVADEEGDGSSLERLSMRGDLLPYGLI